VQVISLGYRTDLMLRAQEGSEIIDCGDFLAVCSPANPSFWWGNFLLLAAPPQPGEAGRWLSRFAAQFPGARHVALGVDGTDGRGADDELQAAGLRVERLTVMTAPAVHDPPHPSRAAICRQLVSQDDWLQAAELSAACHPGEPGDAVAFIEGRIAARRAAVDAGYGSWFGAFQDGRLLSQLGLFGQDGVARYQNVETHPGARRRGLAGTLVCHTGRHGLEQLGAGTLVMVADPGDVAIGVYRSVGFADTETQVGYERQPTASAAG
jgi:ribosomal protein S18 acetylase RimI-like enzyme